ncbi:Hsp70 family protein [Streptomyces sp. NPDC048825]|uniref:Hsp70 family protein n=1 Tax=Streptomyces sp. NPDC048825 TaxID=3365592 RepID=UPI00371FD4C0
MSLIVGIDLGTTNSCLALPADAPVPHKEQLIADGRLRPVGDALLLVPPDGSPTVPSAVWVGPDGAVQVGLLAKHRARMQGAPPAMFFKRSMGTDQRFTAGHAELTPLEASTEVLRHLKRTAEDVLGVPVERAVVTVPAFFETRSKNDTTKAGAAAGLEVVETLIEPVAAALAHAGEHLGDEPRTFLVYDLGGGTFDTSVVTWDPEEGFEHRAFGGDRYLGGYDFDRAIVHWMDGRLPAYDLKFDPDRPADARSYAALLFLAEECKQELSRMPVTEIVSQHGEDRTGTPMNLHLPMLRTEFEELIRPSLEATVGHCERTLRQAGITLDAGTETETDIDIDIDIDEIVMVGGSSRIPLVARLLKERFGRTPVLLHPDLAIAAGAALKAAAAAQRGVHLELDRPEAIGGFADIAGRVLASGTIPEPLGTPVVLVSDDGVHRAEETAGADGSFVFPDVPLQEGRENGFTVRVMHDGREAEARHVTVAAGAPAAAPVSGDVLAHDFSVQLATGPHRIVASGVRLPHRTGFRLQTASQGRRLSIRLYEGLMPIGAVEIDDVPAGLPVGTAVEVTVTFEAGWTIAAEVAIPEIGARATASIDIPLRTIPAWDDLREAHRDAKGGWAELYGELPPAEADEAATAVNRLLAETDALFAEGQDRAKAHYKLMETETLLQGLAERRQWAQTLHPPLHEFEAGLADIRSLTAELAHIDPTRSARYSAELVELEAAGRAAYADLNRYDWHQACTRLDDLLHGIQRDLYGPLPGQSPDDWTAGQLEAAFREELDNLRRTVLAADRDSDQRHRREAEGFLNRIDTTGREVSAAAVQCTDDDLKRRLIGIFTTRIEPLRVQIDSWLRGLRSSEGIQVVLPRSRTAGQGE